MLPALKETLVRPEANQPNRGDRDLQVDRDEDVVMPVPLDDDGAAASGDGRPQERDAEPEGEANHEDEIGEDVEPMRKAPSPYLPSAAEIEEHRKTHIPYRSWCKHCIDGRARG